MQSRNIQRPIAPGEMHPCSRWHLPGRGRRHDCEDLHRWEFLPRTCCCGPGTGVRTQTQVGMRALIDPRLRPAYRSRVRRVNTQISPASRMLKIARCVLLARRVPSAQRFTVRVRLARSQTRSGSPHAPTALRARSRGLQARQRARRAHQAITALRALPLRCLAQAVLVRTPL